MKNRHFPVFAFWNRNKPIVLHILKSLEMVKLDKMLKTPLGLPLQTVACHILYYIKL